MPDQIWIQHRFTITEGDKSFSDALVLPKSEYEVLTLQQIETQKQQRFNNWKTIISTPQPKQSKTEMLASIDKDLASLEEQKTQLLSLKDEVSKGGK